MSGAANPVKTARAVTNLYEQDYIRAWESLLNDVEFVSFTTRAADGRGAPDPHRTHLAITRPLEGRRRQHHSHRSRRPAESGALAARKKNHAGARERHEAAPGRLGAATVPPGTKVTAHFQPIQQLWPANPVRPLGRHPEFDWRIQQHLGTLGPEVAAGDPMDILSSPALRALLQSLKQQSAALPPAIRHWSSKSPTGPPGASSPARPATSRKISTGGADTCRSLVGKSISFRRQQDRRGACRLWYGLRP